VELMSEAWLYAGVTSAVAAVMTAALWRPRPGQWVLLLIGPLLATAAALWPVSSGLGLLVLLVIPYTYLIVPAALPWERAWARGAVPGIVVAGCLALGTPASASLLVRVLLAAPLAIGLLALFRGMTRVRAGDTEIRRERDSRRFGYRDATPPPSVPLVERAVVAVATVQGAAGIAVIGLGVWVLVLEQRHPTTGPWAGTAYVIAGLLAGLGVVIAAMFFGLAQGLRRRYDDFRAVFVVVQVVVGVLLLPFRGVSWTGPGVTWAFGTAALAMFVSVRPATARLNIRNRDPRTAVDPSDPAVERDR
jgi:hypothetical protein